MGDSYDAIRAAAIREACSRIMSGKDRPALEAVEWSDEKRQVHICRFVEQYDSNGYQLVCVLADYMSAVVVRDLLCDLEDARIEIAQLRRQAATHGEPADGDAKLVRNPPERIWLNYGVETECGHYACDEVTWSVNPVHASDVPYVRSPDRLMRALSDAHETIEDVCAALGDRDSTTPRLLALKVADERDTMRRERDEARRIACAYVSGTYRKDVVTLDRAAALAEAERRGWDCFKEDGK